jgi:hypothetical protein
MSALKYTIENMKRLKIKRFVTGLRANDENKKASPSDANHSLVKAAYCFDDDDFGDVDVVDADWSGECQVLTER